MLNTACTKACHRGQFLSQFCQFFTPMEPVFIRLNFLSQNPVIKHLTAYQNPLMCTKLNYFHLPAISTASFCRTHLNVFLRSLFRLSKLHLFKSFPHLNYRTHCHWSYFGLWRPVHLHVDQLKHNIVLLVAALCAFYK